MTSPFIGGVVHAISLTDTLGILSPCHSNTKQANINCNIHRSYIIRQVDIDPSQTNNEHLTLISHELSLNSRIFVLSLATAKKVPELSRRSV